MKDDAPGLMTLSYLTLEPMNEISGPSACHVQYIIWFLCMSCTVHYLVPMHVMYSTLSGPSACHVQYIIWSLCMSCTVHYLVPLHVMYSTLSGPSACHVQYIIWSLCMSCTVHYHLQSLLNAENDDKILTNCEQKIKMQEGGEMQYL